MMDEKHIYLLAQLDGEANQRLSGIYSKLMEAGLTGEQTKDIPYHFTLGRFDLARRGEVLAHTQEVCRRTQAFDIHISHLALFGLRVLFAAPAVNGELLTLYRDLIPGEASEGCHRWTAHATLLIDNPENIHRAIPIAAQNFAPFCARVEGVGAYEFFPKKRVAEWDLVR